MKSDFPLSSRELDQLEEEFLRLSKDTLEKAWSDALTILHRARIAAFKRRADSARKRRCRKLGIPFKPAAREVSQS